MKDKELKTSEEWQQKYPNPTVLNPDGWDRNNFHFAWFIEKISYSKYLAKLSVSTCKHHFK